MFWDIRVISAQSLSPENHFQNGIPDAGGLAVPEAEAVAALFGLVGDFEGAG